jgi:hypothetical protein
VSSPSNQERETCSSGPTVFEANDGDLPRKLARYVLTLGFDEEDQERIHELALRNQDGRLSVDARNFLANFVSWGFRRRPKFGMLALGHWALAISSRQLETNRFKNKWL